MNSKTLAEQVARLKIRFGEKAFDSETVSLIRKETITMRDEEFVFMVDGLIATRPHTKAPLVIDFREGRLKVEKRILDAQTAGATRAMSGEWNKGLQSYLAKEFPGCKTLWEAAEVRRLQIQMQKAEDPNYEPMNDQKWMGGT